MARFHTATVINGRAWSTHLRSNPTERKNPPPSVLPNGGPRELWEETYRIANDYYKGAFDMPQMTAWRRVKSEYPEERWYPGLKHPPNPEIKSTTIPDPGQMITLGRVLEYAVQKKNGGSTLEVFRFKNDEDAPKLLWSPSQRALLILPKDAVPDELNPDLTGLERTANLYRDWSWGQEPRGFTRHKIPASKVKSVGMADTIVYRSGKGSKVRDDPPGSQQYIHQFGDGVVAYQGPTADNPRAIMIRGGDLDVQEPGIIN